MVAVQLVRHGLFPCAPLHPSLAVDIRVLEFVTKLFVRVAPNNTAWSGAVEDFLGERGYHLAGEVGCIIKIYYLFLKSFT